MSHYTIKVSAARMPLGCWGSYRHVAVLEVDGPDRIPTMISTRARGVISVVEVWRKVRVGKTSRCAFARAMVAAEELLAELVA